MIKAKSGFSLIELMVVVAIIGVLASIAVPNFQTYQAKSKVTEAKFLLSSTYVAETSFFTEWDTFATCLGDVGVEVLPQSYYIVGFDDNNYRPGVGTFDIDNPIFSGVCTVGGVAQVLPIATKSTGGLAAPVANDIPAADTLGNNITATAGTFYAAAIGRIFNSANFDTWVIDHTKTLRHDIRGY